MRFIPTSLRRAAAGAIAVAALVGVTVLAAFVFPRAPVFWTIQIFAFLAGLALVPAVAVLLSPSLSTGIRGTLGRIIWTIGSLANGPSVLYWPENGWPEIVPASVTENQMLVDGEWQDIDDDVTWSLLGMEPFGIEWETSERSLKDILATPERIPPDGMDHRLQDLNYERGGKPIVSWLPSDFKHGEDGYVVNILKAVNRFKGAASTNLSDAATTQALKEHGGNTAQLSNKQLVLGTVTSMFLAAVMALGYVVMVL